MSQEMRDVAEGGFLRADCAVKGNAVIHDARKLRQCEKRER